MRFYISYPSIVTEEINEIIKVLKNSGHEVWKDTYIPRLSDRDKIIQSKIEWCEVFIFVISEQTVDSADCLEDLKCAYDKHRPILPLVFDKLITDELLQLLPPRTQWLVYDGDPTNMLKEINSACEYIDWGTNENLSEQSPSEFLTDSSSPIKQEQPWQLGMQVRFPVDLESSPHFRDFRLGQILEIENLAETCVIEFIEDQVKQYAISLRLIQRCFILPNTIALHIPTKKYVQILVTKQDSIPNNAYIEYYILIDDNVLSVPELELQVVANRQDVNPIQQLSNYEFQHFVWRYYRDRFVKSYQELKNATSGLEELVGNRVLLLEHQADVIAQVLGDETCRYILADEVGLGKTIEAIVVLKGLLERYDSFKTLIVTPAPLFRQWYNELNDKFWLTMTTWQQLTQFGTKFDAPGLIISTEQLETNDGLWKFIQLQEWGLVIVDEAHRVSQYPELYQRLMTTSEKAKRVLLLSATPILYRSHELLDLLRLMHPQRYQVLSEFDFDQIIANQKRIIDTTNYLADNLKPEYFDNNEFVKLLSELRQSIPNDSYFEEQLSIVVKQTQSADEGLAVAKNLISYISENYRIENRLKRNRRVSLEIDLLPERDLDIQYAYAPSENEKDCIAEVFVYVQNILANPTPANLEFCELMVFATFSSPEALLHLINIRQSSGSHPQHPFSIYWLCAGSPREEEERFRNLAQAFPFITDESQLLKSIIFYAEKWKESSQVIYSKFPSRSMSSFDHRLSQVVKAIEDIFKKDANAKVVLFSSWTQTIKVIYDLLRRCFGRGTIAQFHIGIENDDLQQEVDRFQNEDTCRVMLCDELGGEGRNFQIATAIIHIDLPWVPARIEQRIGRVDRLGREGVVISIVPFAKSYFEEDLFELYQDGFSLFTQSMSGLEIVLESTQNQILEAFQKDPFNGLKLLKPMLKEDFKKLRKEIDRERIFEENAINHIQREEFKRISKEYADGNNLRESFSEWAKLVGLEHQYNNVTQVITFEPKKFNLKSMQNAKIFKVPDMQDALYRSGRTRNLIIKGTFNRRIAVLREDIVFFAPNSDKWTNFIMTNALESDKGRCSAVEIQMKSLEKVWHGFEFFFSVQVNPRPLFEAGFPPIHLHKVRSYLTISSYSLFISTDGQLLKASHPTVKAIHARETHANQKHLGKRGSTNMTNFIEEYPSEEWEIICGRVTQQAWQMMKSEFEFFDEALEAKENLLKQIHINETVNKWLSQYGISIENQTENHYKIIDALCLGVQHPLIRLESISFWKVVPHD
jgi:ATP-dependent helicase HepA